VPYMNIKLQSELNIRQVAELKEQLNNALSAGDIVLDASAIEVVDAAGLQLLLAFIQQARLKNITIQWGDLSDSFLNAVKLMGLSDGLGLNT